MILKVVRSGRGIVTFKQNRRRQKWRYTANPSLGLCEMTKIFSNCKWFCLQVELTKFLFLE